MASSHAKTKTIRVALIGADTLLGRELEEVLNQGEPRATVISYSASAEGGFGEQEGEAAYLEPLTLDSVREAKAVVMAGSAEGVTKTYNLAKQLKTRPLLIDCTGHLEHEPEARIVAPSLGIVGENGEWLFSVAHPAAIAIAEVLTKLAARRNIAQAIFEVFEPASERGKRGVSELHEQTASLLGFKALKKTVFDAQLSFNLLPQYGEQAVGKLADFEARIDRNLATLLSRRKNGPAVAMPSLRLIQAPVFHGYSISGWVRFETNPDVAEIEQMLSESGVDVRYSGEEAPTNVAIANQSGLSMGDIRMDHNDAKAIWLWIAADNLRLRADAAASLVKGSAAPVQ